MKIVTTPKAMRRLGESARSEGTRIGFVPTMGALHEGHLSLVGRARRDNDLVVASVFVNPSQFGPKEDFSRYPRPFREDAQKCRAAGVDILYHPTPAGMYPAGFRSSVTVAGLSEIHCGASRPGHFSGVATVVLKLIQQVRPDKMYLGNKDFQQMIVVRRMVKDLDLGVTVIGCPIVREPDGLALSSRNRYLTSAQRAVAPRIHAALKMGAAAARGGAGTALRVIKRNLEIIPGALLDYAAVVNPEDLSPASGSQKGRFRALAAVKLGHTRLIDNIEIIV